MTTPTPGYFLYAGGLFQRTTDKVYYWNPTNRCWEITANEYDFVSPSDKSITCFTAKKKFPLAVKTKI